MNFYNSAELNSMKLADITDYYNSVAGQMGVKQVKKFRDKPTAVARTVAAQEVLQAERAKANAKAEPVKAAKPAKAKKAAKATKTEPATTGSRFDLTQTITIVKGEPKEGSIEHSLFAAINEGLCTTVGEVVEYITTNHKRPRSDQNVDAHYAIHNIKWFVRKGHLKLS